MLVVGGGGGGVWGGVGWGVVGQTIDEKQEKWKTINVRIFSFSVNKRLRPFLGNTKPPEAAGDKSRKSGHQNKEE